MRLFLLFLLLGAVFGGLIADIELNPKDLAVKNDMTGTFGYGYLAEDVEYGDILYCNSSGKWGLFDGTDADVLVMSSGYEKAGKLHKFLIVGYATKYNWSWTKGGLVYPTTGGEITQTNPSLNENILGIATDEDEILFRPRNHRSDDLFIDYGEYFYLLHNGWTALNEEDNYRMYIDSNNDWQIEYRHGSGWSDVMRFDESSSRMYFYFGQSVLSGNIYYTANSIIQDFGNLTIDNTTALGSDLIILGGDASKVEFNSLIDTDNNWISGDGGSEGIQVDDNGNVTISDDCTAERYMSEVTTITAGGDDIDVGSCSVLNIDTAIANNTIGGFTNGTAGQILHLYNSAGNNVILEDDEGTGNQDIKTNTGADVTITAEGGATLIYDGTDGVWRIIGIAQ